MTTTARMMAMARMTTSTMMATMTATTATTTMITTTSTASRSSSLKLRFWNFRADFFDEVIYFQRLLLENAL